MANKNDQMYSKIFVFWILAPLCIANKYLAKRKTTWNVWHVWDEREKEAAVVRGGFCVSTRGARTCSAHPHQRRYLLIREHESKRTYHSRSHPRFRSLFRLWRWPSLLRCAFCGGGGGGGSKKTSDAAFGSYHPQQQKPQEGVWPCSV